MPYAGLQARKRYAAEWYAAHRTEQLEKKRAAYKSNPGYKRKFDPLKARQRLLRWRAAHPGRQRELGLRWIRSHRDKCRASLLRWRQAHPERARLQTLRRRALKASAAGTCSVAQLRARIAQYGGLCWVPGCGKAYEAIDHVIPLAKGGSNWPANLRPICKSHNSIKGSKSLKDFTLHHRTQSTAQATFPRNPHASCQLH